MFEEDKIGRLPNIERAGRQTQNSTWLRAGEVDRFRERQAAEGHYIADADIRERPRPGQVRRPGHDDLSFGQDLEVVVPQMVVARRQTGEWAGVARQQ